MTWKISWMISCDVPKIKPYKGQKIDAMGNKQTNKQTNELKKTNLLDD